MSPQLYDRIFWTVVIIAGLSLAMCERGHAHGWQGYAMNHRERTLFGFEPRGSALIITVPYADELAAREKALDDQVACRDIVMYTDAGIVRSRPDGCRK